MGELPRIPTYPSLYIKLVYVSSPYHYMWWVICVSGVPLKRPGAVRMSFARLNYCEAGLTSFMSGNFGVIPGLFTLNEMFASKSLPGT
jgi:hypothetical protein